MDERAENTIEAREESMRAQLTGVLAAASAAEAQAAVEEATREVTEDRGAGYGVGFGYLKSFDRAAGPTAFTSSTRSPTARVSRTCT